MSEEKKPANQMTLKQEQKGKNLTGMIKKLADMRLVSYERYQGVTLTETGQKIALEVIRHHRLVRPLGSTV